MPRIKWHILVFLAPAVLVYTAVMIFPLFNTLRLALYSEVDQMRVFVGLESRAVRPPGKGHISGEVTDAVRTRRRGLPAGVRRRRQAIPRP